MRSRLIITVALVLFAGFVGCDATTSKEKTVTSDEEKVAVQPTDETSEKEESPEMKEVSEDSVPDAGLVVPDAGVEPGLIGDGRQVYNRVCVTCHGETGDGKGLEQKLFGFDAPRSQWTNGPSVDGIVKTLGEGIHETSMKKFGDLELDEARAVANYVLHLREEMLEDRREEDGGSRGPE